MTQKEIEQELEKLKKLCQESDRIVDEMAHLVGLDGPMWEAIWAVQSAYVDAVARLVGDKGGWVLWWVIETEFGAKKHLTAEIDGKKVKSRSPRDIAKIICQERDE